MQLTKCSHSIRSGSWLEIHGREDLAAAGDVLAVAVGVLVEALVVDRHLALERHVVEGRHPTRADDREPPLLVRVEPAEVQMRRPARRGSAGSRTRRPRRRGAGSDSPRAIDLGRLLAGQMEKHRDVVRAKAPERVLVRAQLAEVQAVAVDVVDLAELAAVGQLLELAARPGGTPAGARPSTPDPRPAAASTARCASATDWASGFSTKQCLPACEHPSPPARRGSAPASRARRRRAPGRRAAPAGRSRTGPAGTSARRGRAPAPRRRTATQLGAR